MTLPPLWLDTETFNRRDIRAVGGYEHARTCEIMLLQFAIGDDPVTVVDIANGQQVPNSFRSAFLDACAGERVIIAHNAQYDRWVLEFALKLTAPMTAWRDSMQKAYQAALPGALDDLCQALGLADSLSKVRDGKRLIQLFCSPAPANHKVDRYTRAERPEEWAAFVEYARQDVVAMRECWKRTPNFNYTDREHALWVLDQRCNDAGLPVDVESATIAVDLIERMTAALDAELEALTLGAVPAASNVPRLKEWVASRLGEDLLNLTANSIEELLARPGLPPDVQRALQIRQQGARASGKKYAALVDRASPDGTIKGTTQMAGAYRTRRWAGRGFQPQNLLRPIIKDLDTGIEAIRKDMVDLLYDDPMGAVGSCVRAVIAAPPGKSLCVSDLSGIEGRVLPWLCNFTEKLDRIRAGVDEYKTVAAIIYKCRYEDIEDDSYERLVGKVGELACGYQGSIGAYESMAQNYDVTLVENHLEAFKSRVPLGSRTVYRRMALNPLSGQREPILAYRLDDVVIPEGLYLGTFEALEAVTGWRENNQPIVQFWYDCEDAAKKAIQTLGRVFEAGRVSFACRFHEHGEHRAAYLLARLPSGAFVVWPGPLVSGDGKITYMGPNPVSGKWCRLETYGGKIVENLTQAEARNVMAWNIPGIVEAGYDFRGSVHDEVITLIDEGGTLNHVDLSARLAASPPWADGLPLNAKGYTSKRYRK